MSTSNDREPTGRLASLLRYLADDPGNLTLRSDAAETALAERRPDLARDLLVQYAEHTPLPAKEMNLAGLAALQLGVFNEAASLFGQLLATAPTDTSLRFNLAWARAMLKDTGGALELLDKRTTDALAQAAMLRVQLLHQLGLFEEAAAEARPHIAKHPDHRGLLAAVSVLAIDVEDADLATDCAHRAGDHPDALTTLGTLALGDEREAEAMELFSRALERNAASPRAWVGKGLAELSAGAHAEAARDIQHGAELFGDHLGSWIAAGWAHVVGNDLTAGRVCFEKALALDATFSESHGSLGVMAVLDGRIEDARRLAQTALRLDRQSFSGALAQALILNSDGKPDVARAIIERALHTPIDANGKTIAHALAKHGLFG